MLKTRKVKPHCMRLYLEGAFLLQNTYSKTEQVSTQNPSKISYFLLLLCVFYKHNSINPSLRYKASNMLEAPKNFSYNFAFVVRQKMRRGFQQRSFNTFPTIIAHVQQWNDNWLLMIMMMTNYMKIYCVTIPYLCRVGETPLLTAIHKDDVVAIDLLLKCGAHLTNVDQKSVADLDSFAARSGCVQKLESLRLAGADLDLVNEMGQTPLHQVLNTVPIPCTVGIVCYVKLCHKESLGTRFFDWRFQWFGRLVCQILMINVCSQDK